MPGHTSPEGQLREWAAARPQKGNEPPSCSEGAKALYAFGAAAVLVFGLIALFDGKSDKPQSEPSYRTYEQTGNRRDDEALMSRPSLDGWNDSEKRQIIQAAKKLDRALYEAEVDRLRNDMDNLGVSDSEQEVVIRAMRKMDGR